MQRKIVDPILNATEQLLQISLNGVFSFLIPCFVLEILKFFETNNRQMIVTNNRSHFENGEYFLCNWQERF